MSFLCVKLTVYCYVAILVLVFSCFSMGSTSNYAMGKFNLPE